MVGMPVKLGPFSGGLNTYSDSSLIGDTQLSECTNMELDLNGSLVNRFGFTVEGTGSSLPSNLIVVGTGTFNNVTYIIGNSSGGVYYYVPGSPGTWTLISGTSTLNCAVAVQFQDVMYLFADPTSTTASGSWAFTGSFATVANMPRATTAIVHKGRIYASPGLNSTSSAERSKIYFCGSNAPTDWTTSGTAAAAGNVIVNQGDGLGICKIMVYADNILIFKPESIHFFSFDTSVGSGVIRKLTDVGGTLSRFTAVVHENTVYFYYRGSVYKMINNNVIKISSSITLVKNVANGNTNTIISLSVVEDRLILKYYYNYYVYNIITQTWSIWNSNYDPAFFTVIPRDNNSLLENKYLATQCNTGTYNKNWYLISPTSTSVFDGTNTPIQCSITTKTTDMGINHAYKKLFHWGVDVLGSQSVDGRAYIIVGRSLPTWNAISTYTWNDLAGSTWNNLLIDNYVQTIVSPQAALARQYLKLGLGLRFRQIRFNVRSTTNTASPFRIFGITAFVKQKQLVEKGAN